MKDIVDLKMFKMAIGVNFETDFLALNPVFLAEDRAAIFESPQQDGSLKCLKVEIDNECHPLLPNVYNLAFGPLDRKGQIDDSVRLRHLHYGPVFATIVLHAGIYLNRHPGHYVGIDGSTNGRAWLYYRFIRRNFEYLQTRFEMFGLKYYVRISRLGRTQYQNPFDFGDIIPKMTRLRKDEVLAEELMYNYFVFRAKVSEKY